MTLGLLVRLKFCTFWMYSKLHLNLYFLEKSWTKGDSSVRVGPYIGQGTIGLGLIMLSVAVKSAPST